MKKKIYKLLFVLVCVKSYSEIQIDSRAKDHFWSFCTKKQFCYIFLSRKIFPTIKKMTNFHPFPKEGLNYVQNFPDINKIKELILV